MIDKLIYIITTLFQVYFWIILVRCLLSFIPNINWFNQPFVFIREITDSYLNLFRRFIPPFGGLDFSPIVAILLLQVVQYVIVFILLMFK